VVERIVRDVRHAVRMMRRRVGFSCVVIATIAIGVGATSSLCSLVNAVLLRPHPNRYGLQPRHGCRSCWITKVVR
jgi:hypothetical protein